MIFNKTKKLTLKFKCRIKQEFETQIKSQAAFSKGIVTLYHNLTYDPWKYKELVRIWLQLSTAYGEKQIIRLTQNKNISEKLSRIEIV